MALASSPTIDAPNTNQPGRRMSTDTPNPEDGQTPEEELQAATPDAPESEPVAEAAETPAAEEAEPEEEASPAVDAPVEAAAEEPATEEAATEAPSDDSADAAPAGDSPDAAPESDPLELKIGEGAPAEEVAPAAPVIIRGKIDKFGVAMGTGRRKTSVARVRIKDGNGSFIVNGKDFSKYFCVERDRKTIQSPLEAAGALEKVDIWVRVNGGGTTGQTGAVVLGIARALEARDPSLHHMLADGGFLTRDSRMVERKKYGRRKARRSFQFSKR
jgi:small subunit ribosomal protein S9